jgi:hypothetical protein
LWRRRNCPWERRTPSEPRRAPFRNASGHSKARCRSTWCRASERRRHTKLTRKWGKIEPNGGDYRWC